MSGAGTSGPFADYGRPRRVEGGLRARSTRGAIGRSWWSRRFLEVLESFALGTRLTRGRSYARAGQVLDLDVAPGVVTARVQGSRPQPYRVRIALEPFPEALWDRVEAALAVQAFFSARLLAGDLPNELEELFAATGAPLFPADVAELDQRCNCPDFAVPCKHLAATFYLLAEAFDADPFELLHWRGRRRAEPAEIGCVPCARPPAQGRDDGGRATPASTGDGRGAATRDGGPDGPISNGRPAPRPGRARPWVPPGRMLHCPRGARRRGRPVLGRAGAAAGSAAESGDGPDPAAAAARCPGARARRSRPGGAAAPGVPGVRPGPPRGGRRPPVTPARPVTTSGDGTAT
ncbi:zinc finger protein [Micromonospora sp. ATCC 39149]|nr:zinc finger protein [Micromonospora sp. ATCC 39149]